MSAKWPSFDLKLAPALQKLVGEQLTTRVVEDSLQRYFETPEALRPEWFLSVQSDWVLHRVSPSLPGSLYHKLPRDRAEQYRLVNNALLAYLVPRGF